MRASPQHFRFPLPGPARIALLEGGFHAERNMREFTAQPLTANDLVWLHSYAPEAIAAPLDLALSLADQKTRGLFELPSLRTAIVVLTSLADSPLTEDHRDLLWRAFGVPVFEQLRGWDGAVIARECEVHDGLHIDESAATLELRASELLVNGDGTGLSGEIATGPCECGAETPRLRNVAPVRDKTASAVA